MDAKEHALKTDGNSPSKKNEIVWAFDLGKGSIGEAVRQGKDFLHKASLLIPAELGRRGPATVSGTPANRYRAMKTREAHHERERWLEKVWTAVGLSPLRPREVWQNPKTDQWELKHPADYRLEREFAPAEFKRNPKTGELGKIVYPNGKAPKDGAPAAKKEDFEICYTSSLLRIRLLQRDKSLADWQIYKALRAALQCRGYGKVPWAAKEARKQGKTAEQLQLEEEKKLQQADPGYRQAVGRWPNFKWDIKKQKLPFFERIQPGKAERVHLQLQDNYYFVPPCYYDAWKMGLWNSDEGIRPSARHDHLATSTHNIRFDRADVRAELVILGDHAAAMLPAVQNAFLRWQREGWKYRHPATGEELIYPIHAKSFGEFLCDGPAGKPDETSFEAFLDQRQHARLHRGSFEEWMAALGQKTPSFDNRILNDCILIPRYHVCKVDVRLETDGDKGVTGKIVSDSLLATEVTLLLKLKNLLVTDAVAGQRKLTVEEVRSISAFAHRQLKSLSLLTADGDLVTGWPQKVADRFAINKSKWEKIAIESEFLGKISAYNISDAGKTRRLTADETELLLRLVSNPKKVLGDELPENLESIFKTAKSDWKKAKALANEKTLRPMPGHEEVKAPKTSGRSGYSRVALRILKELILSGESPSLFHARLLRRDAELLRKLGSSPDKPLELFDNSKATDERQRKLENMENRKRGLLVSELNFLRQMRQDNAAEDSWKDLFIPSQTLDALQQRHTENGKLNTDAAVRELLGNINDPIVRHRLEAFDHRLKKIQFGDQKEKLPGFGKPDAVVLEFVREDFMGEERLKKYQKFLNERAADRKKAKEEATKLGLESRSSGLRYELFKAQGCVCLYTGKPLSETRLDEYEIDHIVPRSLGGPDAVLNYVLTFQEVNHTKEKGKLTPFALLHGKEGWDAYVKRVEARATALRNKKVQLLTREDAPDLVERYTALAETAWVSKLAQTIVNLRFNWTNGYDQNRKKRVIVVSGGLTARVRRKYGLDKLLYKDDTDPEVLAKKLKNRDDKRHHALDAMVLTFIPQWARDPGKEGFFRFPEDFRDSNGREDYEQIRKLFGDHIKKVTPRHLAFERPVLADTIYGRRDNGCVMVKRSQVRSLAYKQEQMKPVFNLKYASGQIEAIRDARIKQELKKFVASEPSQSSWDTYCDKLGNGRLESMPGIKVSKVTLQLDEDPIEFKDLSKDGTGAFRTKKKEHRGQFVYLDSKGKPHAEAVRVFDSVQRVKMAIEAKGKGVHIIGFFQSMCLVELEKPVVHGNITLQPGIYKLNTIKKDGRAQLTSAGGEKSPEIGLVKFLASGFKRVD
jgi:CRISPR-associated endonuclease Csn1